jgi:TolA-binding protein
MDAAVQLALAVSYDRAGKWDKALEEYRKIIAKYPALPQSLQIPIIIAEHYRREQKTAEAEKALNDGLEQYQKVIQEHSGQEIAIEAQGLTSAIYLMQKKVDAAVRTLVDISQKYPLDGRAPVALLKAGLVCENDLNDISRAAALYTEFITKYPTHRLVSLAQIRLEKITAGQKK